MQISTGFIGEAGFDLTAENRERKRLAVKSSGVHHKSESICFKHRSMQLKKESPSSEWRDTKAIKSADANQHRLHTTIRKLTFPNADTSVPAGGELRAIISNGGVKQKIDLPKKTAEIRCSGVEFPLEGWRSLG
jgi:hypothetical protein